MSEGEYRCRRCNGVGTREALARGHAFWRAWASPGWCPGDPHPVPPVPLDWVFRNVRR